MTYLGTTQTLAIIVIVEGALVKDFFCTQSFQLSVWTPFLITGLVAL